MSRVVARGALRVDARRAVAKLREHLLVDLHLYLLELVRAAVAGGATHIALQSDADDVIVNFDGRPLDRTTLVRLLDHVLDAPRDREGRRVRLLALGVNAALGLGLARVDVFIPLGPGRCVRARFTPATVEAGAEEAAARPEHAEVTAPPGMPAEGMRVELRRRMGWDVVRRAVAGGRPPEIEMLAAATADLAIPITLDGAPLARVEVPAPLVRVPFRLHGTTRGALEISSVPAGAGAPGRGAGAPGQQEEASERGPVLDLLEHGVRLLRGGWSFGDRFPSTPHAGLTLPVRILVDAEALPTNASRSALREDAPLRALIAEAAYASFVEALHALTARVCGRGEVPEGVVVLSDDARALEEALAACASVGSARVSSDAAWPEEVRALLELPLLRDGLGRGLAPASLPDTVYVWRSSAPVPEVASPWADEIVWVRGKIDASFLQRLPHRDAAKLVEQAQRGEERRRALYAHAPGAVEVPHGPGQLARSTFDVQEGPHLGLCGEVVIRALDAMPSAASAAGAQAHRGQPLSPAAASIRVFYEGRVLDIIALDRAAVPLPFDAALAWPGRLRPQLGYEGVERDRHLHAAVDQAVRIALVMVDREAQRLFGSGSSQAKQACDEKEARGRLGPVIRCATGTLLAAQAGASPLGERPPTDPGHALRGETDLDGLLGLQQARVWPTTQPERGESLETLSLLARLHPALHVAPAGATGRAADGRPVLTLRVEERAWLEAMFPGSAFIPYGEALVDAEGLLQRQRQRQRVLSSALARLAPGTQSDAQPVLVWTRPWAMAMATLADAHVEMWHHALRPLDTVKPKPSLAPIAIAIDSDEVVPDRAWQKVLAGRSTLTTQRVELDLCEALIALVEGADGAAERLGLTPSPPTHGAISSRIVVHLLLSACALAQRASLPDARSGEGALLARIRKLPLLSLLGADGLPKPASLEDAETAHPAPHAVPLLSSEPGFETFAWQPLLVRDARERKALIAWFQGRAAQITPSQLAELRAISERERTRRAFLAGSEHDPESLGDLGDSPRGPLLPITALLHAGQPAAPFDASRQTLPLEESARIAVIAGLPRETLPIERAWVDVLFSRRALCRRALPLAVPVVARVNVDDLAHVDDFTDLSAAGLAAVSKRVHEAALTLAHQLLVDVQKPGNDVRPLRDPRVCNLLAALLEAKLGATKLSAAIRSSTMRWPTVQGTCALLVSLRSDGRDLYFGSRLHLPWRKGARSSDLDSPILHLSEDPDGAGRRRLLEALGFALRDVTHAVATLQARRATSGVKDEAPRLPGVPPHPLLRRTLGELDIKEADGEVEVLDGTTSEVQLVGLDGTMRRVPAKLAMPLQLVVRVDHAHPTIEHTASLLQRIARAMSRHLLAHAAMPDELPSFVRAHLRRAVCTTFSENKTVLDDGRRAPLFEDTQGAWRSLLDLSAPGATWACTHAPPPYPRRVYDPPVLCLSLQEQEQLRARITLHDATPIVARDLAGERRLAAPPLARVALDPAERARCFAVVPFSGGAGMSGEIGLLIPSLEGAGHPRGVAVHIGGRPLCRLDDRPGWPLLAAVNDDGLSPNRYFDAPRTTAAGDRLLKQVRTQVRAWLHAQAPAPTEVLASRWVEAAHPSGRPLVMGRIWLPAVWPIQPYVRFSHPTPDGMRSGHGPLSVTAVHRDLSGALPIGGTLLLGTAAPSDEIARVVLRAAAALLVELAAARPEDPVVATYQWNLRLLGVEDASPVPIRAADGQTIEAPRLIEELRSRGAVWITRGEGSTEGHFPEGAPGFVLRDGSPLAHVLQHRGHALVRELGGLGLIAAEGSTMGARERAVAASLETSNISSLQETSSSVQLSAQPQPPEIVQAPPHASTWFVELWHSIREVLDRGPSTPEAQGESALATAVHEVLAWLRLTGDPVAYVDEVRSGRPVRYDPKSRWVLINPHHDTLRWARGRSPRDPQLVALLSAAAVGEINRALQAVTDAEERRALDEMLRSIGSGSA
ncbi:hypothetical protein [Chondromyces crocatus]|uniref:Uncharacterized protein n=1 Tax=Chondromyces crocatus TaxID=52 RepID=A0A0K1E7V3_CHOCO|nr:hypothetical protein [Chondromyces crocatus]AKT36945.1 uncharacterized protein CMC5_010660 [Chondromyces crocatus]